MVKFARRNDFILCKRGKEIFCGSMLDKLIYSNNIQGDPANVFYTAGNDWEIQQNYF
jgi:hypothetical protein